ncbi:MAG: NifB/NifX family molybdenum-iron cluster-binding protein [Bacteroidales bacterium]|jgi:predicted Fe-Mo cluster-binding NifX family protein
MKIAITSSNGIAIDTEFGKAKSIYVYSLENDRIRLLEKRKTSKFSINNPHQAFSRNSFERVYETIKDCDITYTRRIRDIPSQRCKLLGIKIKQAEGDINKIFRYLLNKLKSQQL